MFIVVLIAVLVLLSGFFSLSIKTTSGLAKIGSTVVLLGVAIAGIVAYSHFGKMGFSKPLRINPSNPYANLPSTTPTINPSNPYGSLPSAAPTIDPNDPFGPGSRPSAAPAIDPNDPFGAGSRAASTIDPRNPYGSIPSATPSRNSPSIYGTPTPAPMLQH